MLTVFHEIAIQVNHSEESSHLQPHLTIPAGFYSPFIFLCCFFNNTIIYDYPEIKICQSSQIFISMCFPSALAYFANTIKVGTLPPFEISQVLIPMWPMRFLPLTGNYCILGVDCGVCIFGSFTVAVVLLPEEWLGPLEKWLPEKCELWLLWEL